MIYKFIDTQGTFVVKNPHKYNLYFPLTNKDGSLLSSISPNLAGDIKRNNEHFLTPPASIEDLRSNFLTRRDFFLKTKTETIRLSFPYEDILEAGFLYHKIIKKTKSLEIEILNFIPFDSAVEVMRVTVKNTGNKEVSCIPTSFIPLYGRSEKSLRDHRHVSALLNRVYLEKYGILLKPTMVFDEKGHKANETVYFVLGFENEGIAPRGQFPSLDSFFGEGDIIHPDAIEKNKTPAAKKLPEFDGKEACGGLRFRQKVLKKNEVTQYFLIMGIDEKEENIQRTFTKFNTPLKIEKAFKETTQYWQGYLGSVVFDFKDKNYNNWLLWVNLQPALRKLFGCSFLPHFDYGKGGRGWRDLWQDALTLLLTEPEKAKGFIINNFKGVRIDGSNATIITKDGEFISDRNRIARVWMDHGIWPYLTLRLYLNRTGDVDILLKEDTYFQDHQFKRAKEILRESRHENYILHTKEGKAYHGTILEHILIQNLVQFFNVGSHNIIRLENADWNDGLDMAPDHGESVTFSFMYAHNLKGLCGFLTKLKEKINTVDILEDMACLLDAKSPEANYADYRYKQNRLEEYLNRVKTISGQKTSITLDDLIYDLETKARALFSWLNEKEWLEEGFFNGYYDNKGKRVEGKCPACGAIRMLLPSQVFAIMSGIATDEQIKKAWLSLKKHLKDKQLGGFRLNTDFNTHHNLDLGRAFGFSYGDKENGAFFSHMVVMLANALYKRGFVKEGFEVFNSLYTMASSPRAKMYPLIPEYFNGEGKGLYLYLTGSASWYIYTLLEEVLGIKFTFGEIYLEPKLAFGNFFAQEINVKFGFDGKIITLTYIKKAAGKKAYEIKEAYLEDKAIIPLDGNYVIKSRDLLKKENCLKVYLG